MKKEKIKKFANKTMWCILWLIVLFISMNSICQGFELVITNTYSIIGAIFLISGYFMIDLSLYIYSYKVYTGKYNWYKFFNYPSGVVCL